MKKLFVILTILVLTSGLVAANAIRVEAKFSLFSPSEEAYRDIYGGGLTFGGEVNMAVWNNLEAWVGVNFFNKKGEMTYTQEEIKLNITPITVGARYAYPVNEKIAVYGGLGLAYFIYGEEIPPLEDVSESGLGFVIKAGGFMRVKSGLFVDAFIKYSTCKVEPADYKVNIGGIEVGIGIGYEIKKKE